MERRERRPVLADRRAPTAGEAGRRSAAEAPKQPRGEGITNPQEAAFLREVMTQHSGYLLRYVLSLTGGDRGRAEDIVQETLLRAWRNQHRLGREGESLRPWLWTVARRIAIDEHRSQNARPPETFGRDLENFSTPDSSSVVENRQLFFSAINSLAAPHREIIMEIYFRGRTVPEAAESLGLPVGTAKSRVYYALKALRRIFEEKGITEDVLS